jgi:nitrogen fixation NifU-like protein
MTTDNLGQTEHKEEQGLDDLYREVIFEHYRRPRNKETPAEAHLSANGHNPVCGDRIAVYGRLDAQDKTRLERVCFNGQGCAICVASASLMTEAVRGKSLTEAECLADDVKTMLRGEKPFVAPDDTPDLEALAGVAKFPVRVKCATLAWTTLKTALLAHRGAVGAKTEATDE